MIITEVKNDKSDFHLKVVISINEIDADVEKELTNIAKNSKIKGFRAGKVPVALIKRQYGSSVRETSVKNLVARAINQAGRDVVPSTVLAEPVIADFKGEPGKDIEFLLQYSVLPKITLPKFQQIKINKPVLELKDKDIDEQIEHLVSRDREYNKPSKVKAKAGDQVTIDAIGYVEGKAFDGGKLTAHKLVLGSGMFIPGFEDQLIGTKAGSEVLVKVKFPDEYHAKNLAGKDSEFQVKVLAVHNETPGVLDDKLAQKYGCDNIEQLRTKMADNMRSAYEAPIATAMKLELFNALETLLEFDIPTTLLHKELEMLKTQTAQMGDEDFDKKSTKEQEEYLHKLATRRVQIGLMLAEYAKLHNIAISNEDLTNGVMSQARMFPGREQEIVRFYQTNPNALESLKGPALETKVVNMILTQEVQIVEKRYSKAKLEKLLQEIEGEEEHVHDENCQHQH